MKKILATAAVFGLGAAAAQAASARYFLSLEGLSDGGNTDSAVVAGGATNASDLDLGPGSYRLYMWAELGSGATDLKGINLAVRTTGDVQITGGNIWQNNYNPAVATRWNAAGFPGAFGADGTGQFADPTPTVAVLEPGISDGALSIFDDQYIASQRRAVFGYVEVSGTNGEIHLINQGSGFLQIANNSIFLGLDDTTGAPAEIPGQPYDSTDWEARITPEPTSLALLGLAAAFGLRRR